MKLKETFPSGSLLVGYEYGFLPFLVSVSPPQGNLKTEGNFNINLFDLPFNASFYYSSLGTVSGLNNHFTVNFDAQKFLQQKKEKLLKDKLGRIGKIDSLNLEKQKLKTKLDYLYLIKDGKINKPTITAPQLDSFDISIPDSLDYGEVPELPSLPDSLLNLQAPDPNLYNDSISSLINQYQNTVTTIEQTIAGYRELNEINLDSIAKQPDLKTNSLKSKMSNIFGGIKKFNVGLTYPDYSQFLVARTPVRGVNLEYNFKNIYVAFTHGKTVNNIFLSNNVLQNTLNAGRNLYNFFDFNNLNDGRRITALKLGYGQKESSHIFIGALYGLGKVSYQDTNVVYDSESNLVGEIDLRWKAKKYHTIDFAIGRSAIQVNDINLGEEDELLNKFLDFNDKTYGLLSRYTLDMKSTELKLTFRLVDPFYRSFGVAFIKSDNIRYEAKLNQKLGKKLSVNLFYRRENDNILGIYSYQNIIEAYGAGANYRPNKHWVLKADFRPLILEVNDTETIEDTASLNSANYIANFVIGYNNRIKKTYFFATGVYSYYQLTMDNQFNIYQNINASLSIQHKSTWTNDLIFNHYRTTDIETVPLASILENTFSYRIKKADVSLIGKSSFRQNQEIDWGYGMRLTYKITKVFSVNISSEKLVLGDFYNSILQNGLESFPYLFSGGLKIAW